MQITSTIWSRAEQDIQIYQIYSTGSKGVKNVEMEYRGEQKNERIMACFCQDIELYYFLCWKRNLKKQIFEAIFFRCWTSWTNDHWTTKFRANCFLKLRKITHKFKSPWIYKNLEDKRRKLTGLSRLYGWRGK